MLAGAVDEAREGLEVRLRPVPGPVVKGPAAEQDVVLGLDDPAEVGEQLGPVVGEPVALLVLVGDPVEGHDVVEHDLAHGFS
ncbi:hypothetical protein Airi01_080170 [Actinoallomurus iriomotensis]|uniref:Uncharacterized protein n=1 Tax=Actinoallomurus iriomotensis TaxID=478107 RepID=A0A9W6RTQ0_9ACTN|nr:hypothetical protein Airi01_080170 [Actinoallomurus iriomotensis]